MKYESYVSENMAKAGVVDFENKSKSELEILQSKTQGGCIGIMVDIAPGRGCYVYSVLKNKKEREFELLFELRTKVVEKKDFYRAVGYSLGILELGSQHWEKAQEWIKQNIPYSIMYSTMGKDFRIPENMIKEIKNDGIFLVDEATCSEEYF